MPTNDQRINGQHQPNSTLDKPELEHATNSGTRFARLRTMWQESWQEDGFLDRRWDELLQVKNAGWHEIANWIKGTGLLVGISLIVLIVDTAGDIVGKVLGNLSNVPDSPTGDGHGLWGTVDHPIRVFFAQQGAHLTVAPGALYAFWQLAGLLGLIGGFIGNAGARITWLLFGVTGLAMVWSASPAGGRAAATGLAALMWALASIFALRGLSLRPVVHNHPPQFPPQFSSSHHLYVILPAPAGGDRSDEDNSIRPLQH